MPARTFLAMIISTAIHQTIFLFPFGAIAGPFKNAIYSDNRCESIAPTVPLMQAEEGCLYDRSRVSRSLVVLPRSHLSYCQPFRHRLKRQHTRYHHCRDTWIAHSQRYLHICLSGWIPLLWPLLELLSTPSGP